MFAYMIALVWGMNLDFYGVMQVYVLLWFFFGCAVGLALARAAGISGLASAFGSGAAGSGGACSGVLSSTGLAGAG